MGFADVYPVPNACQWCGYVLNMFHLKDGGVIRTLQVVCGNSKAPCSRSPRGCQTIEHSLGKCANVLMEAFQLASHSQNPLTGCKHQMLVGPRPHSCPAEQASEAGKEPRQHQVLLHSWNGNMRAKIQIYLLSTFSVSDTWQSPAQFNIITVLIFIIPFLFQCLSNDYLALAFTSGISSYTVRVKLCILPAPWCDI